MRLGVTKTQKGYQFAFASAKEAPCTLLLYKKGEETADYAEWGIWAHGQIHRVSHRTSVYTVPPPCGSVDYRPFRVSRQRHLYALRSHSPAQEASNAPFPIFHESSKEVAAYAFWENTFPQKTVFALLS